MSLAQQVYDLLSVHGLKLATAESCTGGMIAAAITDIAGSSAVFDRGFVTYSNEAKIEMLGVDAELFVRFGAVSEQVATAMAKGALSRSNADIAIAITGVAGPSGGSVEKPVGLVQFALATKDKAMAFERRDSEKIRGFYTYVDGRPLGTAINNSLPRSSNAVKIFCAAKSIMPPATICSIKFFKV
jgi:nicotinamide-nucleotide amidase